MLFLFIIRRLSLRDRGILGAVLILAGLALLGVAATVGAWLVIHGIITTGLGVALCVSAYVARKKAQTARETPAQARNASLVGG
jgi:hypothetical protein